MSHHRPPPSASFDLTGVEAMITGAASGLWGFFIPTLAAAGADVMPTVQRIQRPRKPAPTAEAGGGRCYSVGLDFTDGGDAFSALGGVRTIFDTARSVT